MKVAEIWGTESGTENLPASWGPLAFYLHSALFSSVCLFPHLLSQATQLWPVSLTICSCSCILLYQCQFFFISPLLLSLTTWLILFVSIHSFFLHLVNISRCSDFFRYKCTFKASHCYILLVYRNHTGNANSLCVPNALLAITCVAAGEGVSITASCQDLSFFLLPHHFTCKL